MDTTFKYQKSWIKGQLYSVQKRETLTATVTSSEFSHCVAASTILENYLFFLCIHLEMVIEPELWCSSCIEVEALWCSLFFILFCCILHFGLFFDCWWAPKGYFHGSSYGKHQISLSVSNQPRACCLVYKAGVALSEVHLCTHISAEIHLPFSCSIVTPWDPFMFLRSWPSSLLDCCSAPFQAVYAYF